MNRNKIIGSFVGICNFTIMGLVLWQYESSGKWETIPLIIGDPVALQVCIVAFLSTISLILLKSEGEKK